MRAKPTSITGGWSIRRVPAPGPHGGPRERGRHAARLSRKGPGAIHGPVACRARPCARAALEAPCAGADAKFRFRLYRTPQRAPCRRQPGHPWPASCPVSKPTHPGAAASVPPRLPPVQQNLNFKIGLRAGAPPRRCGPPNPAQGGPRPPRRAQTSRPRRPGRACARRVSGAGARLARGRPNAVGGAPALRPKKSSPWALPLVAFPLSDTVRASLPASGARRPCRARSAP